MSFNWSFWKFNYFSAFRYSSIALKLWSFPDNLDFKVKIVTAFLLRIHFLSIYDNKKKNEPWYKATQKVCYLHFNDIFYSVHLCHIFSILLYHKNHFYLTTAEDLNFQKYQTRKANNSVVFRCIYLSSLST